MSITLHVNGKSHTLDLDPATPLLYALSDDLELRGPKFGCGLGQCGACTVIVNGTAVRSCVTPVSAVAGKEIVTLEGLGTPEKPHPIQKAFIDEQAAQCGFCLNGVILTAKGVSGQESEGHGAGDSAGAVRTCCAAASRTRGCTRPFSATRRRWRNEPPMRAALDALNRRDFLKTAGALIVGFRMAGGDASAQFGKRSDSGVASPIDQLDSWIAIAADGSVTAYSGKEELGQGISTAQQQLVAEELSVPFDRVKLIYCDTALTPDQAYTSGSQSHPANFNQRDLAQACATAREALFKLASQQPGRARGSAHRLRMA